MRRARRVRWRWVAGSAAVVVAGALGTLWLLFQHIPSWYQPVLLTPAEADRAKADLTQLSDGLNAALVQSRSAFEVRVSEERLNAWLAVREEAWPLSREWLPAGLSNPVVVVDHDEVRLAATLRHGSIQTVVSIRLGVAGDEDGIRVRLLDVSGGSLPVPGAWVREHLARLDAGAWPAGRTSPHQHGHQPLPALGGLLEGVTFPNAWFWSWPLQDRQPFRINRLRAGPGELVFELEPLPRERSRR
jgi:hypothetical protein